jgi:hypothetical protein
MFILLFILTLIFIALAGYNLIIEQPNASMVYMFIALFSAICLNGVM